MSKCFGYNGEILRKEENDKRKAMALNIVQPLALQLLNFNYCISKIN